MLNSNCSSLLGHSSTIGLGPTGSMDGGFPADYHCKPSPRGTDVVAGLVAGSSCSVDFVGNLFVGDVARDKCSRAAVCSYFVGPGYVLDCYTAWLIFQYYFAVVLGYSGDHHFP